MSSFSRLTFLVLFASAATAAEPSAVSPPSDPVALAPLIVTAARSPSPLVMAVDPQAPAQPVPAHDGADVLKQVPGFSVIRKGGTDGDPVLRGFAGSRLGILIDGQSIFGGCGNRMDPPTAYVFPAAYDRITIIKGPQTVLHGPGNSAGVVLFEHDDQRLAAPGGGLRASLTTASFGRFDAVADGHGGTPDFGGRATGTFTRADDYDDGRGQAVHSRYRRWSTSGSLAWTPDARTRLEVSGVRSDGEAAYADRLMDGAMFDRTGTAVRFRRSDLGPRVNAVELRAYRNYVDHVMDNYSLRAFTPSVTMPGRSVSNPDRLTTGGLAQVELTPVADVTLTAGLDAQRNVHTLRSTSDESARPFESLARAEDARFTQTGLFAESRFAFAPGRRIVTGARLDHWRVTDARPTVQVSMMGPAPNPGAGHTRTSDLWAGFARYEHELAGPAVTAFAGLGRVQRFPDYWELIKNESAASVTALATRPESTLQFDTGVLFRRGTVDFSLSLFAARIDDFILVQSGVAKPAGPMGSRKAIVTRNVDASSHGGEAGLGWRFADAWKIDASLAAVHADNVTEHRPLAQTPPLEGRVALVYTATRWSAGGLWRVVAAQDRVALQQGNIVGQDLGPTPGFDIVSLHASVAPTTHLRVSVGVDNLLDRTYAEHLSKAGAMIAGFTQTTRVNEPGRLWWLKLDATF